MLLPLAAGRALAYIVHPFAAWRRLPPPGRTLLVAAYAGAGYVTVMVALLSR